MSDQEPYEEMQAALFEAIERVSLRKAEEAVTLGEHQYAILLSRLVLKRTPGHERALALLRDAEHRLKEESSDQPVTTPDTQAANLTTQFLQAHHPDEVPAFKFLWESIKKYVEEYSTAESVSGGLPQLQAAMGFTGSGSASVGTQAYLSFLLVLTSHPNVALGNEKKIAKLLFKAAPDREIRDEIISFLISRKDIFS